MSEAAVRWGDYYAGSEQETGFVPGLVEVRPEEDGIEPPERLSVPLSEDCVTDYFRTIGKVALLNAEQEVQLAKRIEAGVFAEQELITKDINDPILIAELQHIADDGKQAKEHMINANLRLAVSIAKRYRDRGLPFQDLIQEGNLGLMRAVEKFDYKKGIKFSTYATWWIRRDITHSISDKARLVRLPVHVVEQVSKLKREQQKLAVELSRDPSPEELAEWLGVSLERLDYLKQLLPDTLSLDQPVGDEGDSITLGDLIGDKAMTGPSNTETYVVNRRYIEEVLANVLSDRERRVICLCYGLEGTEPMGLRQVGEVVGVSYDRAYQIKNIALAKLENSELKSLFEDNLE